ncbi:MAG: carboxymuconolactone decarboxylase family protein [Lutibacter sp.]|nr:carboxymuconolactone decarboxylase family protein [Lutibacter sp.]MDT8416312.1 carboxymuconolactone decarboxylase family protein [Lutibacter sp.]
MTKFKLHTPETAPESSKEILAASLKQNGFIPNLYGIMAESPELLKAYRNLSDSFNATSLSQIEKNIVWLAVSNYNACHYCMAIHTSVAKMHQLPADMIEALRDNVPLKNEKLETLRKFAVLLTEKRGWANEEEISKFLEAGYTLKNILELVLGIGQKIISNYVNHITQTSVDKQVEEFIWEAQTEACNCKMEKKL